MITKKIGRIGTAFVVLLSLIGVPELAVAGQKERNVALGIGLGLLGGAIVSNGDPGAALGGAVAGGLIAGAASRDHHRSWRDHRRDRRPGFPPHRDHYHRSIP